MLGKQVGKPGWCWQWSLFLVLSLFFTGCSQLGKITPSDGDLPKVKTGKPYEVFGKTYYPLKSSEGFVEEGLASWYGKKFHNRLTANGEVYDMHALTAAHKTLPLPTWVWVLNLENYRGMVIRINDRGPFVDDRIIDLSYGAAKILGTSKAGIAKVRISALPMDKQRQMEADYQKKLKRKPVVSRPVIKSESIEQKGGSTAFETPSKPKIKHSKKKNSTRKKQAKNIDQFVPNKMIDVAGGQIRRPKWNLVIKNIFDNTLSVPRICRTFKQIYEQKTNKYYRNKQYVEKTPI
ncbi:MAG: septal ring lytic transglycosylase RlpA family protein [Magnetococcales bacterium]|nr:septal ring lytic transglycosylase RlpA family protein [Magnetococcales bacterium]